MIARPVRICYNITLDSITHDTTQLHVPPETRGVHQEMAKVELR
jgi:hypothetical protein